MGSCELETTLVKVHWKGTFDIGREAENFLLVVGSSAEGTNFEGFMYGPKPLLLSGFGFEAGGIDMALY